MVFEFEYGPYGTWQTFFRKSENYMGSALYRSKKEENTYFLIDRWVNQKEYEIFLSVNNETYQQISSQFEFLYETEEKTGAFVSL
jgi:quinol monooxygenase YgiN